MAKSYAEKSWKIHNEKQCVFVDVRNGVFSGFLFFETADYDMILKNPLMFLIKVQLENT
jgi:hypothetical protein